MMTGFTFFFKQKDYFVETNRKNKTQNLAAEILPLIGCSVSDENVKALLCRLRKSNCEIKTAENTDRKEKRYYEISSDGFSGRGGWLDDGSTIVLKMS
jgi:hypothetical protein